MSTKTPMCGKCRVPFRPIKLGIELQIDEDRCITNIAEVDSYTGKFIAGVSQIMQKGNLYECPICKHTIIIGSGDPYLKG